MVVLANPDRPASDHLSARPSFVFAHQSHTLSTPLLVTATVPSGLVCVQTLGSAISMCESDCEVEAENLACNKSFCWRGGVLARDCFPPLPSDDGLLINSIRF